MLTFRYVVSFRTLYMNLCTAFRQQQITNSFAAQHRMNQLALVNHNGNMDNDMAPIAPAGGYDPKVTPMSIATISSGFEKGDFLVREEKGQRVVSYPL